MIAQCLSVLYIAGVQFRRGRSISRDFSLTDHKRALAGSLLMGNTESNKTQYMIPFLHHSWHWPGHLLTPDTSQGTCSLLTLTRAPARHLQGTCAILTLTRAPARHLQGARAILTQARAPARHLQGTCALLTVAVSWFRCRMANGEDWGVWPRRRKLFSRRL